MADGISDVQRKTVKALILPVAAQNPDSPIRSVLVVAKKDRIVGPRPDNEAVALLSRKKDEYEFDLTFGKSDLSEISSDTEVQPIPKKEEAIQELLLYPSRTDSQRKKELFPDVRLPADSLKKEFILADVPYLESKETDVTAFAPRPPKSDSEIPYYDSIDKVWFPDFTSHYVVPPIDNTGCGVSVHPDWNFCLLGVQSSSVDNGTFYDAKQELVLPNVNRQLFRPKRAHDLARQRFVISGVTPPDAVGIREQTISDKQALTAINAEPVPYLCYILYRGGENDLHKRALEEEVRVGEAEASWTRLFGNLVGYAARKYATSGLAQSWAAEADAFSAISYNLGGTTAGKIASGTVIAGSLLSALMNLNDPVSPLTSALAGMTMLRQMPRDKFFSRLRPLPMSVPENCIVPYCPLGIVYCADDYQEGNGNDNAVDRRNFWLRLNVKNTGVLCWYSVSIAYTHRKPALDLEKLMSDIVTKAKETTFPTAKSLTDAIFDLIEDPVLVFAMRYPINIVKKEKVKPKGK
jgi:hypothetical protein